MASHSKTETKADHRDAHIGARIRERRVTSGLSIETLAAAVGVTYQQVHKYERGVNRVPVTRLFDIAQALQVSLDYFVQGLDSPMASPPVRRTALRLAGALQRMTDQQLGAVDVVVSALLAPASPAAA